MTSTSQSDRTPIEFAVIIVNYNSGERLKRCLDCLVNQTMPPKDIIVVDNASTDTSVLLAAQSALDFQLIRADHNLGFAAANNLAAKKTDAIWLAFLNPDAYAEPNWLERLADGITDYPWADAFGSLQIDAQDPTRLDGAGDAYFFAGVPYRGHFGWRYDKPMEDGECFAPCAAAAVYRRVIFENLGGFEEDFFCYGEDVDLGFRLRLAGGRAVQINKAIVRHEGSGISGRRSDFTTYHGHRNRIWTYLRNMPLSILILSLPVHIMVNIYLAVRFSLNGQLPAYLRAIKDAIAGIPQQLRSRKTSAAHHQYAMKELISVMTWSPLKVARRQADLKPVTRAPNK